MVKKREKNRITKERVYKGYGILLVAVFVLTPLVCLAHTADDPEISPLIAEQNITVGEVRIWNNDQNLYVKYQTNRPWYMTETHLYVGTTLPSRSISHGRFPYKHENLNRVLADTYTIPLTNLGVQFGGLVYIMAHAVVVNINTGDSETAWKEGMPVGQAMYNTYQIPKVPWVEISISGTEFIWDVFKPGRYMALGSVLRITSNVSVVILYGTGGRDSALGPAVRKSSLLPKNSGTSDEIRLWATCLWGTPSSLHAGNPELVPPDYRISTNPEDLFSYWIDFIHLNGYEMIIPESEQLKKGIAFSWYNMISVDSFYSEGRYFEQFVITISAEL